MGRDLVEHLVGAHMVANDKEELLHMVGVSLSEIYSASLEQGLRIMTHAVYRAQALIVHLLEIAAERGIALDEALAGNHHPTWDPDRVREERLELWTRVRHETP